MLHRTTHNADVTSEVEPSAWHALYPDLAGKVAVVAGASSVLREVMRELGRNGVLSALVADDRDLVTAATDDADQLGIGSFGVVADAGSRETWQRVRPHIEQRLGPIDIAVVVAPEAMRLLILSALIPDMAARRRGVLIECGSNVARLDVPAGLRHVAITAGAGTTVGNLAATVAFSASDVLNATHVATTLG